ncbi:TetR/AcrR family transcriptional regulator [Ktedonosporobacter rubrisoli]|uniref:TetR/AcrR family transcriptional regulator n=1 Tax=Ktedonosporobacter rubrisoli TaxID=2509675 RepID=A0A4P6JWM0_KTERU|nr:TetR/AcrR family transcriptional regulator [Ktedonosporobacter rubrisoli]QBD79865.1 TetR/AcrR family transcriptional regulator [Ktedonosporobacter rubrisoli]
MRKRTEPTRAERMKQAIRHRQDQEKLELRQTILRAASELFLEQGYEKFSMRGLAERIGYSATTLYLYFRDKDDLLFAVVDEGFTRFERQLEAVAASKDDPWERLMALGEAYISFGLHNPAYYELMFMQRTDFLMSSKPGTQEPRITAFLVLEQTVQQAIDAGVIIPGNAKAYSDALWAQMHGIVSLAISSTDSFFQGERLREAIEAARSMIFRGLHQA